MWLYIYWVSHNSSLGENFKIVFMTNYCNQTLYIGDIMGKFKNGGGINLSQFNPPSNIRGPNPVLVPFIWFSRSFIFRRIWSIRGGGFGNFFEKGASNNYLIWDSCVQPDHSLTENGK